MITNEKILTLIKHYQNELRELQSLLKTLENEVFLTKFNAKDKDLSELKSHIRFLSFFIASFLDILVSLKVLLDSDLEWDRKFHVKNAFVSIYETIQTYNKHQKEIRQLVQSEYPELETEYNSINLKVREFKKKYSYDTDITNFRNKAGAHYDENFEEYLKNLNMIDKPQSVVTIKEYGDILDSILNFWLKIVDALFNKVK
jgi:hypothetical protein